MFMSLSSVCVQCSSRHCCWFFFFQAEDGIRDLVRSRGLGDVYKRQVDDCTFWHTNEFYPTTTSISYQTRVCSFVLDGCGDANFSVVVDSPCLLYTSDAADERSSVDLGGRRIIKKQKQNKKKQKKKREKI